MTEWLDEWWRGFVMLPAIAQFLIVFGILCAICAGLATYLFTKAIREDNYRGARRRGDAREVREILPSDPVSSPDRSRPAFAIKWNGVSGAHRLVKPTIEGETRPLHPGHIAAARARVRKPLPADYVRVIEPKRLKEPDED